MTGKGRGKVQDPEALAIQEEARTPKGLEDLSAEETRLMLHELRVHQIELEMQNEELRRTQAELHAAQARYFDLYDLAPVGYCTVGEKGLILQANLAAAAFLGVDRRDLLKQSFTRFIAKEDQDIFYLHRRRVLESGEAGACRLRMTKDGDARFWAHLAATAARGPSGEALLRLVMLRCDPAQQDSGEGPA